MGERYEVAVRVASQRGHCTYGYKPDDEWVFCNTTPSKSICLLALQALLPAVFVLMFGGSFAWEPDPSVITNIACPDAKNPVTFEVHRGAPVARRSPAKDVP